MLMITTKDNYYYKHIQEMKMEVEDIEAGKSYGCKFKVRTLFDNDGALYKSEDIPLGGSEKFVEDGLGTPGDYEGFGVISHRDAGNKLLAILDQNIEDKTWIVPWSNVWDIDDVEWVEDASEEE